MSSAKALAARWRSEPGVLLVEEVVARLVAGRPLEGLELDEHEGRVDLRYLPAPMPQRLERFEALGWFVETLGDLVELRGVGLSGLDLSGAQLQSLRFSDAMIVNCRFDGAACRDWRLWGTRITGCSFSGANLRGAAVGTWHRGRRNEWRQVDFTGADFRVAVSQAALYEDCRFDAAKLTKVRFEQCAMMRCHFAGALSEVVFDGRELPDRAAPHPMVDVDFAGAQFDQVELLGCKLDRVIIPADRDITLIRRYRCVVERALDLISGDDSLPARMLRGDLQNTLRMMRPGEEDNLFNRRDYLAFGEDLAALATTVFTRAQALCGP
jgi:uncharacterized protein YjbI with pentapeptide repeats